MTIGQSLDEKLAEIAEQIGGLQSAVGTVIGTQATQAQTLAGIAARLAKLEAVPDPEPDTDPEPDRDTDPEPDPDTDPEPDTDPIARPAGMDARRLDPNRFVCFHEWNEGGRYERWQDLMRLRGQVKLKFRCIAAGGQRLPFNGATYTLCGGKRGDEPIVSVTPPVGSLDADFAFDASTLAEGWHVMDIKGGEVAAYYPMFVLHSDTALPQEWMPVVSSTYEANNGRMHRLEWVPAVHKPTVMPLVKRAFPHFSEPVHYAKLWREEIVPVRRADIRRPNLGKEGILNTANMQWYYWSHFVRKVPLHPLLDGPRGSASLGFITHAEIGKFVNPLTNEPGHMLYVLDPWRVVRIKPNGSISTLVGYRHKPTPNHWADPADIELVGDWSAIPSERRGFHETWGMAWDQSSLMTDEAAQPIPDENNLRPHLGKGPAMLVTDSQNNRVLKVQFVGASSERGMDARHDIPPVVTEWLTGVQDPWDIVEYQGTFLVSERTAHRICQYDNAGELLRVVVQGEALATVDVNRFVQRRAPLELIRAQPVVAPEGLYMLDDWLYYASAAMQQVKRINLQTGEIQVVVAHHDAVSTPPSYVKIAVSDGTFGPRGTVFVTAWTNRDFGAPTTYLPDGKKWQVTNHGPVARGLGGIGDVLDYNGAVACRDGRLVYGSSKEGLVMLSAGLPDDPTCNVPLLTQGKAEWEAKGYDLVHGDKGFGFYGLPLPWGESEAIDYFLAWMGHKK